MIDLHTHSSRSDGTDAPADLVAQAAQAGLGTLAITDHDTTAAVPAARWAQVRATAERLGYNACTILSTPTTGGLERIAPLCALP